MDIINNVIINSDEYKNSNFSKNSGNGNNGGKKNGSKIAIITLSAIVSVLVAVLVFLILYAGNDKKRAEKQLTLGQKYLEDGEYDEAIACFEKALEIDPLNSEAYEAMADAYIETEEYETALHTLDEGIKTLEKAAKKEKDSDRADELNDARETLEEKREEVETLIAEVAEAERIASLPYFGVTSITDSANDVWGRRWNEWNKEDFITLMGTTEAKGERYYSADEKYMYHMSEYGDYLCENIFETSNTSGNRIGGKYINIRNEYSGDTTMFLADYYYQQIVNNPKNPWQVYRDGVYDFANQYGITGENGIFEYCSLSEEMFEQTDEIEINTEFGLGTAKLTDRGDFKELVIYLPETDEPDYPDIVSFRWEVLPDKNDAYVSIGLGYNY